jgi:hypothetical protein
MTRSIVCGLLALTFVGVIGVAPLACQSGGVGDPCTPEDEYNAQFSGFNVAEENIESLSFQCSTRICLVNHFQGRVSCPLGQTAAEIAVCNPSQCPGSACACTGGQQCVQSESYAPQCTCDASDTTPGDAMNCADNPGCTGVGGNCDPTLQICTCAADTMIDGVRFFCQPIDPSCTSDCPSVLNSFVCHTPQTATTSDCQSASNTPAQNANKQCCVPGTDQPVSVEVCGQCDSASFRDATNAVYCSCRCCAPCCTGSETPTNSNPPCSTDMSTCGSMCDPNFNYCSCPSGFTCSDIRPNVGLGDTELAGAYCIKTGSAYGTTSTCGNVAGNADPANCQGTPTGIPTGDGG